MLAVGNTRAEMLPRRGERRFLIDEMMARVIIEILGRHLERVPEEQLTPWRTTVYCDTPDWQIFRSLYSDGGVDDGVDNGVLMRLREYHANRPRCVFSSDETWLEFKPVGQFAAKTRYALSPKSVPGLLRGEIDLGSELSKPGAYLKELIGAQVRPIFVSQYHRLAFATPGEAVRITADSELTYFTLPEWRSGGCQSIPCRLGSAYFREAGIVIEMKWLRGLPKWARMVTEFLSAYSLRGDEHKFVLGVRHLPADVRGAHSRGVSDLRAEPGPYLDL